VKWLTRMYNVDLSGVSRGQYLHTLFTGAIHLRVAEWGHGVKGMLHTWCGVWCFASSQHVSHPHPHGNLCCGRSYSALLAITRTCRADDDMSWCEKPDEIVTQLLLERLARTKVHVGAMD